MFGFGDKNKVHKVTIANTGETFEVEGKINLLQAAVNAGIKWPCDCKVGSCGTCRAVLKEGKVKELTDGLGADVIYDAVGGDIFLQCMRCVNWKGRVLVIGFPAGIPKVPTNLALLKGCSIVGVFWGSFTGREPEENAKNFEELFALHSEGKLKPEITKSYSLDQAIEAIKSLEDRTATGKVVIEM